MKLKLKGCYDPLISAFRYGTINIGLELTWIELQRPSGILTIKIPFLKKDYAFYRYKKYVPARIPPCIQFSRAIAKIDKINVEITKGGDKYGLLTAAIQILEEVAYGEVRTLSKK